MIPRQRTSTLPKRLRQSPAVALLGSTCSKACISFVRSHRGRSTRVSDWSKAPKFYWRDSGILHTLAGLHNLEQVLRHPICGASWEGYCIEQILGRLPKGTNTSHYRTHAGAEVDLVIEKADSEILAAEIKRMLSPKLTPGLVGSMETLTADRGVIVISEGESYPLSKTVTATGLLSFLKIIS